MKKRILLVNEASFLSTGYATYGLELMKRLHASNKYELCELACYAKHGDQMAADIPWKWKSAMPVNEQEREIYYSNHANEFGEMKFEETCLEFKPDFVISFRDPWMDSFIRWSPFRPFYYWVWMPTVDAMPQHKEWIELYANANAIFTYSDWGLEVLRKQCGSSVNALTSAPAGADFDSFQLIQDKGQHRQKMGIDPDAFIVGTVMRNQRRKLYPDLMESFALFLKTAPADIANKTFLYLHTSWPDLGWDIPHLISEYGIGHKTLFTYFCKNCGCSFPSFFQDSMAVCRRCNHFTATFPNSSVGVTRRTLSDIMNLWDCYVQYSCSEGLGMPQIEAAACGLPVFSVDYSAMADVVRKLNGFPIKVQRFFREPETHRQLALPNNEDFVIKLTNFLSLPEPIRKKRGFESRRLAEKHYNWDETAEKWMGVFDSVNTVGHELTWNSPKRTFVPNQNVPKNLSNEQFVCWGLTNMAGRPDLIGTHFASRIVRDLNWGMKVGERGGRYFDDLSTLGNRPMKQDFVRENAVEIFLNLVNKQNKWESRRIES